MEFEPLSIPEVVLIRPQVFGDERGFFMETWNARRFAEAGIWATLVQQNHSRSPHGVLRGLHYQIRRPQGKLVRVGSGEVFDVAVDLRRSSPTFGRWTGAYLSADNQYGLWIPPGFAHGFYVTSETTDFLYSCSDYYCPEDERCLRWDDMTLAIAWPLIDGQAPVLSEKDRVGVALSEAEVYP